MTVSHFGRISPPSLRINFELPSLRANCEAPPLLPLRVSCDARSVYVYKDADAKLRTRPAHAHYDYSFPPSCCPSNSPTLSSPRSNSIKTT
ncbi:hypothetical protein K438DRAFT_1975442 [Mycena galopus ATCC 62051]|nr:hypothetical protein K438DRAFT_1975442 [Mycena galopus ATCC 62051]